MICKYCHDKDNGWVRVPDGHGCVEWTHCVCMPTDPVKHEAVMTSKELKKENNEIENIFQRGWELHDRVVRPARVSVIKN